MDEMSMRLSELEAETEETVKQTGKLTVMQERDHAMLQKAVTAIEALHEAHKQIIADQEELRTLLHNIQRHLDSLTERADSIDQTADILEDRIAALDETVKILSSDMDNLYEDMNVLSAETRNRGIKLKEDVQRFLWDSTESKYDEESDTMW
ncbi:MAG: hypothetical protein IK134_10015 [Oscillospiraceae bacterium]|jgi:chromosome segregation ATPase|nr:hypothetical protein [Oscillospiraceae bacterium]MBQ9906496.1 hypothetical protein [Oscillospiraceae bacterium]MBR5363640.1 hypothetical protein [Oscillospiraceae bacterium]